MHAQALADYEIYYLTHGADLAFGSVGPRVILLQKFLSAEDKLHPGVYPSGMVTGYFGGLTRHALANWQNLENIEPAAGYFGPKTKLAVSAKTNQAPPTARGGAGGGASQSNLPGIPDTAIRVGANPNYQIDFVTALATAKLSGQDVKNVQNAYGAMVPVPTIAQSLASDLQNGNAQKITADRQALTMWDNYFAGLNSKFSSITVPPENKEKHRAILAWLKYNRDFIASVLSSSDAAGIESVYQAYNNVYFSNHDRFIEGLQAGGGLAVRSISPYADAWSKIKDFVDSLKLGRVYAQGGTSTDASNSTSTDTEEGQYNLTKEIVSQVVQGVIKRIFLTPFGGTIAITDVCTTGELLTISGPGGGGSFFLYWGVYAFNPFPYKVVSDGNWTIGYAFNYPGVCNKGYVTYTEGSGFILFFGTSKSAGG